MAQHLAQHLSVPMLLYAARGQHMAQHVLLEASQVVETATEFGHADALPVSPLVLKQKKERHRAGAGGRDHALELCRQFGRDGLREGDERTKVIQVPTSCATTIDASGTSRPALPGWLCLSLMTIQPPSRSMTSRLSAGSVTGRWPVAAISIHSVYRQ